MLGLVAVFASLLAGGTATAVGSFAFARRAEQPGAGGFAALMAGAALWSLTYAVALVTFDPGLRAALELPLEVGKALIAPAWLAFSLGYTGRGAYLTPRAVAAVMAFPVATVVATATNSVHGLMWTGYAVEPTLGLATVAFDPGPWFFVHALYGYGLIAVGLLAVVQTVLKQGPLYREQTLALVVGSVPPTVFHLKRTFELGPLPYLDFTPLGLAVTGLAFGYALFRFDLLGFVPASRTLGRRAAVDNVGVGIAVVDDDGVVVEVNDRMKTAVDAAGTLVGTNVCDFFPASTDGLDDGDLVELDGGRGRRTYEVTADTVTDHHDTAVARTLAFTDVTTREQRRQRLNVLNRVLRHNLRNDMNVVLGHAELLSERLEAGDAEKAEAIVRQAEGLVELGEKARQLDRISTAPDASFDAAAVVETATATATDETAAATATDGGPAASVGEPAVTVQTPSTATVRGDPETLAVVVENLVENALIHGAGRVSVTLSAADGYDLVVADDGGGIPEAELAAVLEGSETALQHGSGVGLWLVRWGTDVLGADLTFDTDDGTTVTVSLPAPE
ncbi:MAG: histidine kinase N-terminal 7TM domain-containing protein [Halolamina sp.]